jgi:hypothetical protein
MIVVCITSHSWYEMLLVCHSTHMACITSLLMVCITSWPWSVSQHAHGAYQTVLMVHSHHDLSTAHITRTGCIMALIVQRKLFSLYYDIMLTLRITSLQQCVSQHDKGKNKLPCERQWHMKQQICSISGSIPVSLAAIGRGIRTLACLSG